MRGGKFLAEESPETLMRMYQSDSLENVFLKLSLAQIQGKRRRSIYLKEVAGSEDPSGVCKMKVPFHLGNFSLCS